MKHKNGEAAILLRLVLVLSALAVLDRAALASPLRLPGSYRYEEQSDAAIPAQPTPSVLAQTTDVEVLASDSTHVVFALTIPTPVWREQVVDGKTYDRISIPGWAVTDDAGEPQVPVKRFLVGIPLGADVQVRAVKGPSESTGERVLLPAPRVVLDRRAPADPDALSTEGWQLETEFVAPSARPAAAGPYPGTVARVAEVGHIRDQRVAAIEVYPVQYDPSSGRVESYSRLELEIGFSYPAGPALQAHPASASPAFESILRDQLVNYQSARSWRGIETSAVIAPWLPPANSYRLLVADDGLYRLTYDQLAAAGLPVSTLDPRKLQVFWQGQEIAVRVIGEGDGSLGPADYLLFYGQAPHGKYARQSVYWLAYDLTNGRRMPVLDGSPLPSAPMSTDFQGHIRVEDDARYMAGLPGDDLTERWYWLNAIAPVDLPVEANLGVISPETATASLGASVFGFSSDPAVAPDHHARFYVNGHFVGEHWWDGNTTAEWVEFDLPQSYLTSLTNTLTASFPGDTGSANEFSLFDRFELTYHRAYVAENERLTFARSLTGAYNFEVGGFTASDIEVYDVSDPLTVKRITGGILSPAPAPHSVRFGHAADGPATLLALTSSGWLTPTAVIADIASDLGNPTNHAGYVVISHADFLLVAGALASYRASTGLDAMTIDVQDVYDQFNYGVSAPQAVRAFLQYAFEMWQLPPTYVVLLGDGTYDPKDNRNLGTVSYVHPYLAYVDPWLGETAADNRFVSVSGSDIWPDMLVGRLPANTLAQAQAMFDKTVAYEQSMRGAAWNSELLFVADDPDSAGDFWAQSDAMIGGFMPWPYTATRHYYLQTCSTGLQCKQNIANTLNTTGSLIVNYIGHGATAMWSGQRIFDLAGIDLLTNADRWPIMLPMTCLEGYFIDPRTIMPSLAESLVRAINKGAVASWSPTGLGVTQGHEPLDQGFFQAVFYDGVRELGLAAYLGKLNLYATGSNLEQIEEYTLFGDPALHINALDADVSAHKTVSAPANPMPGDQLLYTLTFANAGPATAHGVILTDLLPAGLVNPTVVYQTANVVGTLPGADYTWQIADLAPGETGEIRVQATIDPMREPPFALANQVSIAMNEPDLDPANNASTIITPVTHRRPTDLQIGKAVQTPPEPQPGDLFTYTLTFTNAGPGAAHGVVITDLIPTLLLDPVVVYTSPEVVGLRPGAPFAWSIVDLPAGASGEIWFTAVAAAQPLPAYSIENSAQITSRAPETAPADNVATVATQILRPDLRLSKTVSRPADPMPGDVITYTLGFANAGAAVARGVQLVDWLPAELVSATVVYSSPEVISQHLGTPWAWDIVDLAPAAGGEVRIRAVISPTVEPPFAVVNQAAITSTVPDAVPADNLVSLSFGVMMPDLWIAKEGPADVQFGDLVTYTISWGNQGSLAVPGARITDTLPPGVSYVGDSSGWQPEQPAAGVVVWHIAPTPVPTATQGTFVLTGSLALPPQARSTRHGATAAVVNRVEIAGDLPDGDPANNASAWSSQLLLPDVSVQKAGVATVDRGASITYSISWANGADTRAPGVRITDTLPAGVTYAGDDSGFPVTQPAPGVVVWDVAPDPLLPGESGSFAVTGQVSGDPNLSPLLRNRVAIGTLVGDDNSLDNRATWQTAVLTSNLAIDVAAPPAATWGDLVTYTISWASDGAGSAPGVRITGTLPAGVDYLSDDSGFPLGRPAPGVLVWDVEPDLVPAGAGGTFLVTARVSLDPAIPRPLVTRVAVSTAAPEANLLDNQAESSTAVVLPDLSVRKSGPAHVVAGSVLTYTLSFSNDGQGMALDATVTDPLPQGVTYLGDNSGLAHAEPYPGTHAWSVHTLPPGGELTFDVWALVRDVDVMSSMLTNTVVVTSRTPDADWSNHLAWWSTAVSRAPAWYYLPLIVRNAPAP